MLERSRSPAAAAAVAGQLRGEWTHTVRRLLHDPRNGPVAEALRSHAITPVNFAEDRSLLDPGSLPPLRQRRHGVRQGMATTKDPDLPPCAVLVGLGAADVDAQALGLLGDILDVEADQLGASEAPDEADEPVSYTHLTLPTIL